MFSARLLLLGYGAILLLVQQCCSARSKYSDCTSSCGKIHNISHPFRLKTDPIYCGSSDYELACENNLTLVRWGSVRYHVQAIHYRNFTIRLAEAKVQKDSDNFSSTPRRSLLHVYFWYAEYLSIPYSSYRWNGSGFSKLYRTLVLVNCAKPVDTTPPYFELFPGTNSTYNSSSSSQNLSSAFWYVMSDPANVSDLMDSCHIELIGKTSLIQQDVSNISHTVFQNSMAYGFELSWYLQACCEIAREGTCNFDDSVKVQCKYYLPVMWHLEHFAVPVQATLPMAAAIIVLYRVALFLCGAPCAVSFLVYKWRRRHLSIHDAIEEFLHSHDHELMPIRYSYSDIKKITKGFKEKLGEGGYGSVYKGRLRSGRFVAVKMLGKSKANGQEFINEVAPIGRIHHVNVVNLIGFCAQGSKRALLYEFMPNGSLDKYIISQSNSSLVSNKKMYEISLGIARGIEYLHRGCNMQILHFDIKPHNILLDENFSPKVSDFGLAKLYPTDKSIVSLTAARGTIGYMAPELFYKNIGGVSYRADVYSFGMLLMEMAGRRKNLNANEEHLSQIYFPSWVYDQISQGKDVEAEAATEEDKRIVKKMIMTALWCIQFHPSDRPSMHKVVGMLEGEVESIEMPPKPFVSPQEMKPTEEPRVNTQSTELSETDSNGIKPNAPFVKTLK